MVGLGTKQRRKIIHDFCYGTKKEAAPVKKELISLIHEVQDLVRNKFTFQYTFIGSSSRNMITRDRKSNIGFDFDVNIEVNDDDDNYSAKEIRQILKNAFDKIACNYGYDYCEDSTRVLTIKFKDQAHSRIVHSCDLAIVNNCNDGRQQYIRYDKAQISYSWEYQPAPFHNLDKRIEWLKDEGLWNELKKYYIIKKNSNSDPDKHSRSLFAEAVNELCQKNGCRI